MAGAYIFSHQGLNAQAVSRNHFGPTQAAGQKIFSASSSQAPEGNEGIHNLPVGAILQDLYFETS